MKREKAIFLFIIILVSMIAATLVAEALLLKKVEDDYMNNKMAFSLALNTHKIKHEEYDVLFYAINKVDKNLWVIKFDTVNQENYYSQFNYRCGYDNTQNMYCEELL